MYSNKQTRLAILLLGTGRGFGQELLTLEQALQLAQQENREIKQSVLEQDKTEDTIGAVRTRRLPQFSLTAIGGQLLTRPSIEFRRGAFGDFPDTGPIPNEDTRISAPRSATALLLGQAALPLSQQRRIGLQLDQLKLQKLVRGQDTREGRQKLTAELRRAYYQILELQGQAENAARLVSALEQSEKTAREHVEEKAILMSELLDVRARLERARADAYSASSRIMTQKETLNLLVGRPIETDFRVSSMPETSFTERDIAALRAGAAEQRPDVHRAQLRVQMSELDSRIKRSEYTPDVSLSLTYLSAFNVRGALPSNIATAGLTIQWDGIDWGRKRNELAEKAKTTQQARLQLEQTREKAKLEIGATIRQLTEVQRGLGAARAAQESARETLRVAQMKFEEKSALLKDVLAAQSAVSTADFEHQRALVAYLSAEAELKRVLGEEQ